MAYNTRFTCNFTDLYGMDYRLEIKEDGFVGTSADVFLGAGGFRLTYSGNNRGVGSLIMGSKVEFQLQVTNAAEKEFIKDLALSGDRDFICTISRDEGAGHYQFWTGFIISDLVTFQDAPFPFSFNVVASDGFGLAREIDYTNSVWDANNKPSDVYRRHSELLVECFGLIGILDEVTNPYPFMIADTLLKETDQKVFSTISQLYHTRINTKAFVEYDTQGEGVAYSYKSVYEVLEEICKTWNARLIQYNGQFWFIPVANYLDVSADFFAMDSTGSFTSNSVDTISLFIDSDKYNRLTGGSFDFYPPLAKSCVEYSYNFDPLNESSSEELDCGVNTAAGNFTFFEPIIRNFTNYGDNEVTITISYDYETAYAHNPNEPSTFSPPEPSAMLMNFDISIGDYKCVREISSISNAGTPSFETAYWAKNFEHTFNNLSNGLTTLDISIMDCFGMPDTEEKIKVIVDGVEYGSVYYIYDEVAKTIEFPNIPNGINITDSSAVTVVFNNQKSGKYQVWMQGVDIDSFPYTINAPNDLVLNIPAVDVDGDLSVSLYGGQYTSLELRTISSDYAVYGNVVTVEVTNHPFIETNNGTTHRVGVTTLKMTALESTSTYSAQPTNSSSSIKECLENDNDSAETITINMITGDRSQAGSDSNIEIYNTSNEWEKSSEWVLNAVGLNFTGRLSNCINSVNIHTQEAPSLRYNGSLTRTSSDLFNPIKGIKIPTFNETDDNLYFGGGSFVASEAIWDLQMIQLGVI